MLNALHFIGKSYSALRLSSNERCQTLQCLNLLSHKTILLSYSNYLKWSLEVIKMMSQKSFRGKRLVGIRHLAQTAIIPL